MGSPQRNRYTRSKQQTSETKFFLFQNFDILGHRYGEKANLALNGQKACPHSVQGTKFDMIVIFSTLVQDNNISRLFCCIFIFLATKCAESAEIAQNGALYEEVHTV